MNARQRKKQYKKQHGYNPPNWCKERREKRRRKRERKQAAAKIETATRALENLAVNILPVFATTAEMLGNIFSSVGQAMLDYAETLNT